MRGPYCRPPHDIITLSVKVLRKSYLVPESNQRDLVGKCPKSSIPSGGTLIQYTVKSSYKWAWSRDVTEIGVVTCGHGAELVQ